MYLYDTHEGEEAREFARSPLPSGGEWPEVVDQVERVEVWASNVNDPGSEKAVETAGSTRGPEARGLSESRALMLLLLRWLGYDIAPISPTRGYRR